MLFRSNPYQQGAYPDASQQQPPPDSRTHTLLDSQGFFSDFAGEQHYDQGQPPQTAQTAQTAEYGGPQNRYSNGEALSPTVAMAPPMLTANDLPPPEALEYQLPLEPRDIPFSITDPHDQNLPMTRFDNLAAVLRHRRHTIGKTPAFWVLDSRGKETASVTWEKFALRAEKVAQVIRDKSSLYRGDRVALVYRDTEIIDFAIALMGCFIAGVVAVPINRSEEHTSELQSHS